MEDLTLTSAITIPTYRVIRLAFDWPGARIKIVVRDPTGDEVVCTYNGANATSLMNQLNTIDLTVQSLHKRILNKLVTDGKLPGGTVTGTPD